MPDLCRFARARELLATLQIPCFLVPGNHDDRRTIRAAFASDACPCGEGEFLHYVVERRGTRLIGVDSTVPGLAGRGFQRRPSSRPFCSCITRRSASGCPKPTRTVLPEPTGWGQ